LSRRLAAISAGLAILFAASRVETARRPKYGGTLRVQTGPVDPGSVEVDTNYEIVSLIYDHRKADGSFAGKAGSGPFRELEWMAGKHATLAANEDFREGRPFIDRIEIQMGRAARDRLVDLELGKADFAEIPVEMARQASDRGVRLSLSKPDELLALVFTGGVSRESGRPVDEHAREALAAAVDRASIVNFILQKNGEAAGGLLPQWSSGTAFLFSTAANPGRAKELWAQIPGSPKFVLGYDFGDALEQSVAERIVVNAREVGIAITARAAPRPHGPPAPIDGRIMKRTSSGLGAFIVRMKMPSAKPWQTLEEFGNDSGVTTARSTPLLTESSTPEEIYTRERAILDTYRVVPLVWLPQVYGLSARVRNWVAPGPGETWPLADVWLDTQGEAEVKEKP
jgi:Bacterial extracellular solute-binding proteins, family 5 Middle